MTPLDPQPVLDLVAGESSPAVARRLGISESLVRRWRLGRRRISRSLGDRIAIELGYHPANLWPEEWQMTTDVCGTHLGYDRGCRCQPCKTGKADRNRQLRRIQADNIIDRFADTLHQITQQDWRTNAACKGANPALWFPDRDDNNDNVDHALAICHTCPVRAECLNDNLNETYGIFGGTTPMQRRALRKLANETRGVA